MTYSIVAAAPKERLFGVAVASKAMCVGAHVPWGGAGVGALATQAWHDLRYGSEGFQLLRDGHSVASALQRLSHGDPDAPNRQLGMIDTAGRIVSYTGSQCLPWAGGLSGAGYCVQGNLLAGPQVVEAMAASWEANEGLAFLPRLAEALLAGDEAGGDRRGRQSAAVHVWRQEPPERPDAIDTVADVRVDDAEFPVHRLAGMVPRVWLEYGAADEAGALPLAGETRTKVAALLGVDDAGVEAALESWVNEENLESRLLPGRIDPTVLAVLESGAEAVLERARAAPPARFWPG